MGFAELEAIPNSPLTPGFQNTSLKKKEIIPFLRDIASGSSKEHTVVVLDSDSRGQPRQYTVKPSSIRNLLLLLGLGLSVGILGIFVFTPVSEYLPGRGLADFRSQAADNKQLTAQLRDSLAVQSEYMEQLRVMLSGGPDVMAPRSVAPAPAPDPIPTTVQVSAPIEAEPEEPVRETPAPVIESPPEEDRIPAAAFFPEASEINVSEYMTSLRLPMRPPVSGYVTRRFTPGLNHYGIDIAVPSGTLVRSVGDGFIIFSDWTNDGGYTIMIQHPDDYVSVYKHNQELVKLVGERVRDRDAIAISGSSGEISSGPHAHFEIWHKGLPQDPDDYFIQ